MAFSVFILIIVTLVALLNSYLIWKMYTYLSIEVHGMRTTLTNIDIDAKLTNAFADNTSTKSIDELTKMLTQRVKQEYGVKGNSYMDIVDQIKASPRIDPHLKRTLVEFFEEMLHVSYKDDVITEEERDSLQQKVKAIMHSMQHVKLDSK